MAGDKLALEHFCPLMGQGVGRGCGELGKGLEATFGTPPRCRARFCSTITRGYAAHIVQTDQHHDVLADRLDGAAPFELQLF